MRRDILLPCAAFLGALAGCAPQFLPSGVGLFGTGSDSDGGVASAGLLTASTLSGDEFLRVSGSVNGAGDYELFDLGSGLAGDKWAVSLDVSGSSVRSLTVVLFDSDLDLLMRARVSSRYVLEHIARLDTPHVYLGVTPSYSSSGGDFELGVELRPEVSVPPARQQVVYLNFGGASQVQVHSRGPISFDPFDGAVFGALYADHTQLIKDTIVATMCEDYADYEVVLLTSDDGPPPSDGPYATVHFGGADSSLLGLADSVDMYNEDPWQTAVVYVESFAQYSVMRLEPDEMAVMVGNVASHELGHLLGLYHTKDPNEIMDSTGSAWDLAGEQTFHRGPLEDTVFPTGMENTPRLLEQTVGLRKTPLASSAKMLNAAKWLRYQEIRRFAREELRCRCGNCLNPDY